MRNFPVISKQLHESESFDVMDDEDMKKGKELLNKKDDVDNSEEEIVDADATTITELKDSYIGNAILQCPSCRTLIYKKPDLLVKAEDSELYNVGDSCPHCGSEDGYNLVGQVAKANAEDAINNSKEETTGNESTDKSEEELPLEEPKIEPEESNGEPEEENTDKEEENVKEESFDYIDSKSFNKLISESLKERFKNVSSFSSTKVETDNNKLFVEGKLTFTSTKVKPVRFVFESVKDNNKYTFTCIKESFTKNTNTFSITASCNDKHLISESYKVNK